jgi:hypothetical protein
MSNNKINFKTVCPKCQTKLSLDPNLEDVLPSPKLRSGHKPTSELLVYRESTETIRQFLIDKCRAYAPDVNIQLITRYSEKKSRKANEPHVSYAYFILCMTANEALAEESDDMYIRLGSEGRNNLSFISEIKKHIIDKYSWDYRWVHDTLNSYKDVEKLENQLGITPTMLAEIGKFCDPSIIKSNNVAWVEVAISAEKVLNDMFMDMSTQKTIQYKIIDTRLISETNVEYLIHVDPYAKGQRELDKSIMALLQNSIKNK